MESHSRLRQSLARMQALLCLDLCERFRGVPGHSFEQGFDLRLAPHKLDEPLRLRKPSMIFVNSTSDLFHEDVPESYIREVADVMLQAARHSYQVLTKRSERMRDMLNSESFRDVARIASTVFRASSICARPR